MSGIDWTHATPSVAAAFLASLVEFVEALTVVIAVGAVRGWRHALVGTGLGLVLLLALVLALGPALARIPLQRVQLIVGTLLLLFGLRWLRKAILRSAGVIGLHDEAVAYAKESEALRRSAPAATRGLDWPAVVTAFQIVVLEGVEVVFIVIAIGAAGGLLVPATVGAGAALLCVALLGLALHKPLTHIPENLLKFTVGVLLAAFGTFWTGEGLGLAWPGEDWSLLALIAGYLAVATAAVRLARMAHSRARPAAAFPDTRVREGEAAR